MAVDVKGLTGNEIADDYERVALTEGRWATTWNVFKKSFGKMVLINLLMLVFFAPAIAVLVVRNVAVNTGGMMYPFNANTGLGYPANIGAAGLTENLFLSVDLIFTALLVACGLIASIGIAGGAYCIRKILNTEGKGKLTFNGFFHGVKVGYFKTVLPVTVFMALYFSCVICGDWKDLVIARGGAGAGPTTAYAFLIIFTVLIGLYCAWLWSTGISYRLKFPDLLKYSLVFSVKNPVATIFMAGFALLPAWVYLIGTAVPFVIFIAYVVFALFGFSLVILVWLSYSQWIFDMYDTPKFKEEVKKNTKKEAEEPRDEKDVVRELVAAGKSELAKKPILPIAEKKAVTPLGQTFTRADIEKVNGQREALKSEISAYENAHKNEPAYAEYNKLFADREKALQPATDKKGKKKNKVSKNNLLSR